MTITRGEEDNRGKKGKGQVKEHEEWTHGHRQWGGDWLWEWGGRVGESNGENGGTTEIKQKNIIKNKHKYHAQLFSSTGFVIFYIHTPRTF